MHQVIFEHYAFPGLLLIGTDSHTPNGGNFLSASNIWLLKLEFLKFVRFIQLLRWSWRYLYWSWRC